MLIAAAARKRTEIFSRFLYKSQAGIFWQGRRHAMADIDDRWQELIRGLRTGERQATRDFWERYGAELHRVAAHRLPPGLRARLGPEDVVQSVCPTFLRRAQGGEFTL